MQYFYDGQFKNVLSQFMRIFSGLSYLTGINHTGKKEMLRVPCKVGNPSRMVAMISQKNSENVALSAPFISCWMSNVSVNRRDTLNPTAIEHYQVNEQAYDDDTGRYTGKQGNKYQLDRYMPVPYNITMQVDIWTSNEEMKLQILEQILVMFNPAVDFQKNENPFDASNLLTAELTGINYSSRSVPAGGDVSLDITTLTFDIQHFYLNAPAKLKRQVIIQNIMANPGLDTGEDENGVVLWQPTDFFPTITTFKNLRLAVSGNELKLLNGSSNIITWNDIFAQLPIEFGPNLYNILLRPGYEIRYTNADLIFSVDAISSSDPTVALGTLNTNTLPATTIPSVDDFINPNALFPGNGLIEAPGKRYAITHNIIPNTQAWGPLVAQAGSVIETIDGVNWVVSFDSTDESDYGEIVRNLADGELYVRFSERDWIAVVDGTYNPGFWRIVSTWSDNQNN